MGPVIEPNIDPKWVKNGGQMGPVIERGIEQDRCKMKLIIEPAIEPSIEVRQRRDGVNGAGWRVN